MYQKALVLAVSVLCLSACGGSAQSSSAVATPCSDDYKTSFNEFVVDRQNAESFFDSTGHIIDKDLEYAREALSEYRHVAHDCNDMIGRFSGVRCFAQKESTGEVTVIDPALVKQVCDDATAKLKLSGAELLEMTDSEVISKKGLEYLTIETKDSDSGDSTDY